MSIGSHESLYCKNIFCFGNMYWKWKGTVPQYEQLAMRCFLFKLEYRRIFFVPINRCPLPLSEVKDNVLCSRNKLNIWFFPAWDPHIWCPEVKQKISIETWLLVVTALKLNSTYHVLIFLKLVSIFFFLKLKL